MSYRGIVDIYYRTGDTLAYLDGGLRQVGLPSVQTAPITQKFTMADGSIVVYPSGAATDSMTVELECTLAQAQSIRAAAYQYGSLIFAGLHHMQYMQSETTYSYYQSPIRGVELFCSSSITSEMICFGEDLCKLSIPVELCASWHADSIAVPAIQARDITIFGETIQIPKMKCTRFNPATYKVREPIQVRRNDSRCNLVFAPGLPSKFDDTTIRVRLYQIVNGQYSALTAIGESDSWISLPTYDGERKTVDANYSSDTIDFSKSTDFCVVCNAEYTSIAKPFYIYFSVDPVSDEEYGEGNA